jgi:hypothetical protein
MGETMKKINGFLNWAKENGWKIILNNNKEKLPQNITERYNIPDDYKYFLENIRLVF